MSAAGNGLGWGGDLGHFFVVFGRGGWKNELAPHEAFLAGESRWQTSHASHPLHPKKRIVP